MKYEHVLKGVLCLGGGDWVALEIAVTPDYFQDSWLVFGRNKFGACVGY